MAPRDNSNTPQSLQASTWNLLSELTGISEPESHLRGFSLEFGDGSRWWVAGLPAASHWVENVATIMQMRPEKPNGASAMIILEGETPLEKIKQLTAPGSGWLVETKHLLNLSLWYRQDSPDLLAEIKTPVSDLQGYSSLRLSLQFIHRQSIRKGGLPFHAALVERQGKGVLLAAASGTGKSTCCRRIPPPWRARCDDEVLVVLTPDGRYLAHPFPTWSACIAPGENPTYNSQESSPLAGIFFFEQSQDDECFPLHKAEAAVQTIISSQVAVARLLWYCPQQEARKIRGELFANACNLVRAVPTFRLRVSLTGQFWEQIEAALGMC